jgi:uncharacterized protein
MENSLFSNERNRNLGTVALIMFIVALGTYANYTWQQSKYLYTGPTTISVTGEGEVMSVPDIGQFSFSVNEAGTDAKIAREALTTKTEAILNYLKEAGVEEKDIKTESYNLYPKYKYESRPCAFGSYCPPGEQIQDGFEVSQMVRVKVRDIDKAGELLTNVGDKGATNISGLDFTIDDPDALKAEARELAIADAKAKAEALAEDLGVRLVKMVGYNEDGNYPMPYYGMGGDMVAQESAKSSDVAIPVGENETVSRVTITYQIR